MVIGVDRQSCDIIIRNYMLSFDNIIGLYTRSSYHGLDLNSTIFNLKLISLQKLYILLTNILIRRTKHKNTYYYYNNDLTFNYPLLFLL